MPKIEDRIASLEGKLRELRVQQQRTEARKRAAAQRRTRADDTRRKILVGAVVLDQVARGHLKKEQLRQWLDDALVRADDRALFDLPSSLTVSLNRSIFACEQAGDKHGPAGTV